MNILNHKQFKNALWLALALNLMVGCQATSSSPQLGLFASTKYEGKINPINKPVLVKFRPYPRSRMTKRSSMQISDGKQLVDLITEINGFTRIEKNNSSISFISEIENGTLKAGEREENLEISGEMIFFITESGEILDFKDDVKSSKTNNQNKEDPEAIANLIKIFMPALPRNGLLSGYDLFQGNASLFEELNKAAGHRIINIKGIVRGSTTYNNRYSIVVDYKGLMFGLDLSGYGIMDAYSGAWVYSSMKMKPGKQMIAKLKGKMGSGFEVTEIRLSPETPKYNFTPIAPENGVVVQPAVQKPVGKPAESRLRELKRLHDAGLITAEEAAKKRQEILDGI